MASTLLVGSASRFMPYLIEYFAANLMGTKLFQKNLFPVGEIQLKICLVSFNICQIRKNQLLFLFLAFAQLTSVSVSYIEHGFVLCAALQHLAWLCGSACSVSQLVFALPQLSWLVQHSAPLVPASWC